MEVGPRYKQTELGMIPSSWEVSLLDHCVRRDAPICYGILMPGPHCNKGVPVVKVRDIIGGRIDESSLLLTHPSIDHAYRRSRLAAGDLLVTIRGTTGRVALVPASLDGANITQDTARVRLNDDIDAQFLFFALHTEPVQRQIALHTIGQAVRGINIRDVKDLAVVLPDRPSEQRAIAAALSGVDALLGGLDRLIAKKRDLKQAAMQQLLTGQTRLPGFNGAWEVKRLGGIAEIVMGQSPSSSNYNSTGRGMPLIQGNADILHRKTIRRVFTTQVTKRGMAGDILMSVRAPVGEVSRAMFDVCLGRGVCAIRFPNDFLYYCLIFLEPSWARHSKGSTFDSVNSTDVRGVEINLPTDYAEQTAIAAVLSDMDAELAVVEARRDKTRDLKQAMMQELLTGKTRLVPAGAAHA